MIALRSALFNALLYVTTAIEMIVFTPYYFLVSRQRAWFVPKFWSRANNWLLRTICGTNFTIDGLENIDRARAMSEEADRGGGFIVAPKHQSFWDTFTLLPHLRDPVIILKRDLLFIPGFGMYLARMNMIAIRRGTKRRALDQATDRGREEVIGEGRELIIYPEGTRRAPGDEPVYKYGVTHLYHTLGVPVVPVAWNPGLFWPRRRFRRYPGLIRCRVLEPIAPGLPRDEFTALLTERLEAAQDELLLEQARDPIIPPFVDTARARVEALTGQTLEEYRKGLGLRPDSPFAMGRRGPPEVAENPLGAS